MSRPRREKTSGVESFFGLVEIFQVLEIEFLIFVFGCGWWEDNKKIFICSCRVWGWVALEIVNQS